MLIVGEKYKFTQREREQLSNIFDSIQYVNYKSQSPSDTISTIENHLFGHNVTIVVLNIKSKVDDSIIKYLTNIQYRHKIKFTSIEDFLEEYLYKCYIPTSNRDLDFLSDIKPFTKWQQIQKRSIDYLSVIILGAIATPVMLYSCFKIKNESPGSIFFRQNRIGKRGKSFRCIKFRSMHENSYHDPYTKKSDPRIFPWGGFMRKTRIDELPQLLNILKGEMHLVGPRAEWDILVKEYEKEIPFYMQRHITAPGITGWAQVNYPYGANLEDTQQKLMYDLYYIKHWSLALELKTIYKTILVVLGKKGV